MAARYRAFMGHSCRSMQGGPVTITWGRYTGVAAVVHSAVFQRIVVRRDEWICVRVAPLPE